VPISVLSGFEPRPPVPSSNANCNPFSVSQLTLSVSPTQNAVVHQGTDRSILRRFMSSVTVEKILDQIDTLDEDERLLLEERLAARAESEWQQAAEQARHAARQRGINQAVIDRAVEAGRY
jgi:hypothetical protein